MTGRRIVGAVHPVAVALPRLNARDERVPDEPVDLGQRQPGLDAVDRIQQEHVAAFVRLANECHGPAIRGHGG